MPLLVTTYLKEIPHKGIGLIAGESIKVGQIVYKDDLTFDKLIPRKEVEVMPKAQKAFIEEYCSYWKKCDSYYLCADNARFWNHSFNANTKYNPDTGEVLAIADIKSGEELTSDYREFDDSSKEGDFGFDVVEEKSTKTLKDGGSARDELADMAWDIGISNKWIINNQWKDEQSKQKAFNLAKAELYHFAKGGKAKGLLDGMDWIITGKYK